MDGLGEEASRRLVQAASQLKQLQDDYVKLHRLIAEERRAIELIGESAHRAEHLTERHKRQHEALLHAIDSLNRKSARIIEENKLLDDERSNLQAHLLLAKEANEGVVGDIAQLVELVKIAEGERQRAGVLHANKADSARELTMKKKQSLKRSLGEGSLLNRLQVRSDKCNHTSQFVESVLTGV